MARLKKPENETPEQMEERQYLESIANHATRSEKTSWNRKYTNMKALLDKLNPIEEEIIRLMGAKQPILDDIQVLRRQMIDCCVHPYDMLSLDDGIVTCKFCNTVITKPRD
jgi:hypothetical protein